jgi:hypothetical protein
MSWLLVPLLKNAIIVVPLALTHGAMLANKGSVTTALIARAQGCPCMIHRLIPMLINPG